MKIEIEPLSDKWPSEKNFMINDWLVYAKSVYFNDKYSYYSQVFLAKVFI